MTKQTTSNGPRMALIIALLVVGPVTSSELFLEEPRNASVPEGQMAIMKCKLRSSVSNCRWYYKELGKDFNNEAEIPKLVKEFKPSSDTDCSIRFTKVRKVQQGQWLCQAMKYMSKTVHNSKPASLVVIDDSDEREHQGFDRTRDPTAPTAIPAIEPPPPPGSVHRTQIKKPNFEHSDEDYIQNTRTGERVILKCKVDQPISSCAWIMPSEAHFVWNEDNTSGSRSSSINTPIVPEEESFRDNYEFIGSKSSGNCSLLVRKVTHADEGNWRCMVSVRKGGGAHVHRVFAASSSSKMSVKGPLIHLHLLDAFSHGSHQPSAAKPSTTRTHITLIILFLVGIVLFIIGAIIIYCCYKKVWSKGDQSSKTQQTPVSRNNESEYQQQWFQGRNLKIVDPNYTDDFKLGNINGDFKLRNIDAINLKNAQVQYSDLDHYNQYMSMKQVAPSVRSSASSNTTLNTVVADPVGVDRQCNFGMNHGLSPLNMQNFNNTHTITPKGSIVAQSPTGELETVPFYEIHRKIQRPVSLYSTGHVYEEIQEKVPIVQIPPNHMINSDGVIVPLSGAVTGSIATTPVYTNIVEDNDGYLIPNKSKIINAPTENIDPSQYLPMRGEIPPSITADSKFQNLNDLSCNQIPTQHIQVLNPASLLQQQQQQQQRRYSNESQVSQHSEERNYAVGREIQKRRMSAGSLTLTAAREEARNIQMQLKKSPTKTPTTPNSRRQRMPLPKAGSSQPALQIVNGKSQIPAQKSETTPTKHTKTGSTTQQQSAFHQRTSSLPDTSNANKINHAKSPSLVPTANYDVPKSITETPRTLAEVPRSVNGSEISLDDIDGTIV